MHRQRFKLNNDNNMQKRKAKRPRFSATNMIPNEQRRQNKNPPLKYCRTWRQRHRCDNQECPFFHTGFDCDRFFRFGICDKPTECRFEHRPLLRKKAIKIKNGTFHNMQNYEDLEAPDALITHHQKVRYFEPRDTRFIKDRNTYNTLHVGQVESNHVRPNNRESEVVFMDQEIESVGDTRIVVERKNFGDVKDIEEISRKVLKRSTEGRELEGEEREWDQEDEEEEEEERREWRRGDTEPDREPDREREDRERERELRIRIRESERNNREQERDREREREREREHEARDPAREQDIDRDRDVRDPGRERRDFAREREKERREREREREKEREREERERERQREREREERIREREKEKERERERERQRQREREEREREERERERARERERQKEREREEREREREREEREREKQRELEREREREREREARALERTREREKEREREWEKERELREPDRRDREERERLAGREIDAERVDREKEREREREAREVDRDREKEERERQRERERESEREREREREREKRELLHRARPQGRAENYLRNAILRADIQKDTRRNSLRELPRSQTKGVAVLSRKRQRFEAFPPLERRKLREHRRENQQRYLQQQRRERNVHYQRKKQRRSPPPVSRSSTHHQHNGSTATKWGAQSHRASSSSIEYIGDEEREDRRYDFKRGRSVDSENDDNNSENEYANMHDDDNFVAGSISYMSEGEEEDGARRGDSYYKHRRGGTDPPPSKRRRKAKEEERDHEIEEDELEDDEDVLEEEDELEEDEECDSPRSTRNSPSSPSQIMMSPFNISSPLSGSSYSSPTAESPSHPTSYHPSYSPYPTTCKSPLRQQPQQPQAQQPQQLQAQQLQQVQQPQPQPQQPQPQPQPQQPQQLQQQQPQQLQQPQQQNQKTDSRYTTPPHHSPCYNNRHVPHQLSPRSSPIPETRSPHIQELELTRPPSPFLHPPPSFVQKVSTPPPPPTAFTHKVSTPPSYPSPSSCCSPTQPYPYPSSSPLVTTAYVQHTPPPLPFLHGPPSPFLRPPSPYAYPLDFSEFQETTPPPPPVYSRKEEENRLPFGGMFHIAHQPIEDIVSAEVNPMALSRESGIEKKNDLGDPSPGTEPNETVHPNPTVEVEKGDPALAPVQEELASPAILLHNNELMVEQGPKDEELIAAEKAPDTADHACVEKHLPSLTTMEEEAVVTTVQEEREMDPAKEDACVDKQSSTTMEEETSGEKAPDAGKGDACLEEQPPLTAMEEEAAVTTVQEESEIDPVKEDACVDKQPASTTREEEAEGHKAQDAEEEDVCVEEQPPLTTMEEASGDTAEEDTCGDKQPSLTAMEEEAAVTTVHEEREIAPHTDIKVTAVEHPSITDVEASMKTAQGEEENSKDGIEADSKALSIEMPTTVEIETSAIVQIEKGEEAKEWAVTPIEGEEEERDEEKKERTERDAVTVVEEKGAEEETKESMEWEQAVPTIEEEKEVEETENEIIIGPEGATEEKEAEEGTEQKLESKAEEEKGEPDPKETTESLPSSKIEEKEEDSMEVEEVIEETGDTQFKAAVMDEEKVVEVEEEVKETSAVEEKVKEDETVQGEEDTKEGIEVTTTVVMEIEANEIEKEERMETEEDATVDDEETKKGMIGLTSEEDEDVLGKKEVEEAPLGEVQQKEDVKDVATEEVTTTDVQDSEAVSSPPNELHPSYAQAHQGDPTPCDQAPRPPEDSCELKDTLSVSPPSSPLDDNDDGQEGKANSSSPGRLHQDSMDEFIYPDPECATGSMESDTSYIDMEIAEEDIFALSQSPLVPPPLNENRDNNNETNPTPSTENHHEDMALVSNENPTPALPPTQNADTPEALPTSCTEQHEELSSQDKPIHDTPSPMLEETQSYEIQPVLPDRISCEETAPPPQQEQPPSETTPNDDDDDGAELDALLQEAFSQPAMETTLVDADVTVSSHPYSSTSTSEKPPVQPYVAIYEPSPFDDLDDDEEEEEENGLGSSSSIPLSEKQTLPMDDDLGPSMEDLLMDEGDHAPLSLGPQEETQVNIGMLLEPVASMHDVNENPTAPPMTIQTPPPTPVCVVVDDLLSRTMQPAQSVVTATRRYIPLPPLCSLFSSPESAAITGSTQTADKEKVAQTAASGKPKRGRSQTANQSLSRELRLRLVMDLPVSSRLAGQQLMQEYDSSLSAILGGEESNKEKEKEKEKERSGTVTSNLWRDIEKETQRILGKGDAVAMGRLLPPRRTVEK